MTNAHDPKEWWIVKGRRDGAPYNIGPYFITLLCAMALAARSKSFKARDIHLVIDDRPSDAEQEANGMLTEEYFIRQYLPD